MKYYIECKNKEEFDTLITHYEKNANYYEYIDQKYPYGFIIDDNNIMWKGSHTTVPTDVVKITFNEWKIVIAKEKPFVRYLGTKCGKNSGNDWEKYFNEPGLKAGDVGYIYNSYIYNTGNCLFEIKDEIRNFVYGAFKIEDLELITKEEYEAGLRAPNKKINYYTLNTK